MNEKEVLDIIALGAGMALGLLASALISVTAGMERKTFRLALTLTAPLCLLSLPSLAFRLSAHRISPALDTTRLLAFCVMGFTLAGVMELADRRKKRKQRETESMEARKSMVTRTAVSSRP